MEDKETLAIPIVGQVVDLGDISEVKVTKKTSLFRAMERAMNNHPGDWVVVGSYERARTAGDVLSDVHGEKRDVPGEMKYWEFETRRVQCEGEAVISLLLARWVA